MTLTPAAEQRFPLQQTCTTSEICSKPVLPPDICCRWARSCKSAAGVNHDSVRRPEDIAKVRIYFIISKTKQVSLFLKIILSRFQVIAFLAHRESSGIIVGQNIVSDGGSVLVLRMSALLKWFTKIHFFFEPHKVQFTFLLLFLNEKWFFFKSITFDYRKSIKLLRSAGYSSKLFSETERYLYERMTFINIRRRTSNQTKAQTFKHWKIQCEICIFSK